MTKLTDIIPDAQRCKPISPMCPAVFKTGLASYVIVGKIVDTADYVELAGRIGPGECAVEINAELLEAAINASK